jgi:DNA-binding transcriptional MerR regulator
MLAQKAPEAFRTISEVATELDVPQHVLRFWESKFPAVKPLKRGGGRRYYRPDDVDILRGIQTLLYSEGLTIKGVQKILREQGPRYIAELGRGERGLLPQSRKAMKLVVHTEPPASNIHQFRETEPRANSAAAQRAHFERLLEELVELKGRLRVAKR